MLPRELKVKVITPKEVAFNGVATAVTIPAEMGEMQVLAGHIPVAARVQHGNIVIFKGSQKIAEFEVEEGFFRVTADEVSLLMDNIIPKIPAKT